MPNPTNPQRPLVSTVIVLMLAFCLSFAALLAYLSNVEPATSTEDTYHDGMGNTASDPFRLSGCFQSPGSVVATGQTCPSGNLLMLPQHASHLLGTLYDYVRPWRGQSPNTAVLSSVPGLSTPMVQGRHLRLTLDSKMQTAAQATVDCYTGDLRACDRCPWCSFTTQTLNMFEFARAASLGMLVINAKTGAIEAAASAYTKCYAERQQGIQQADCPELPNTLRTRPGRLDNQALEQQAKPGSITKFIIAAGLYQAGLSPTEAAQMPLILKHSLTLELIDIVMCKVQGFDAACARRRLAAIADVAKKVGWNNQYVDVLSSGQLPGLQAKRFGARLLSAMTDAQSLSLTQAGIAACAARRWQACQGANLVDIVAELYGTGEALASPLGVANALLQLVASASQQTTVPLAHLVDAAQDDWGQMHAVAAKLPPALSQSVAQAVLQDMSASTANATKTTKGGTANAACLAAARALPGGRLPCEPGKNQPVLVISGKTGTPLTGIDVGKTVSLTLEQWRSQCIRYREQLAKTPAVHTSWGSLKNEVAKCNMVPSKWYAFLVREAGSPQWDKIVVVLAERNWNQTTGKIDSPNDRGSNVAAEVGLALVNGLTHPSQPVQSQF